MGRRFYEYLLTVNQLFSDVYFSQKVDTIFPILQMTNVRLRQIGKCAPSFRAGKRENEHSMPGSSELADAMLPRCFSKCGPQKC